MKCKLLLILAIMSCSSCIFAQQMVTISGKVKSSGDQSVLPFASIVLNDFGATTNESGKFSLRVPKGKYIMKITFLGFAQHEGVIELNSDTSVTVNLIPSSNELQEFVIEEEAYYGEEQLENSQMSTISLNPNEIKAIPSLAGEADLIKVAQLLPGVSKGIEGGTDFFVRGGDADQNLVLLDGATVYNTGHLFGFMSVFNPDAIGEVTMINGAFPSYYGGRLSSILDIRTQSEIPNITEIDGSIGLISSRLTIRKPFKQQRMSFMLSGRRTYIDQVLARANAEVQLPYYFYDLNGRFDYHISQKDQLFVSGYFGADILDYSRSNSSDTASFRSNFTIKNNSQSFGWKHFYSNSKYSDLSLSRTYYAYNINNSFEDNGIDLSSDLEDYAIRYKMQTYMSDSSEFVWGGSLITHSISPSILNTRGIISDIVSSSKGRRLSIIEGAVYGHLEKDLNFRWRLNMGYRHSFAVADGTFYHNYEPRISFRMKIDENSSLKGSYSRMSQYMHRVSSSAISLPTDVWFSVTKDIKPQTADQVVVGYLRTFPKANLFVSVESYYKNMNNLTEYEEGSNLVLSTDFEDQLIQGTGNSYGIETLIRRKGKRWQGWVSYTLSWTNRYFADLNNSMWFPAKYDRRHNVSIVGQYDITKRITFSAVWEYISGARFTPIIGQYTVLNPAYSGVEIIPVYSERNAVGLSDAHRLDIGLIISSKEERRFKSKWQFGIYNVYNRATPVSLIIVNENGGYKYVEPGLFGLIPSVSYNFEF